MAEGPGGEKTEKATPKKRKDAREKEGNVLQSKEITTAVTILGIFVALRFLVKFMYQVLSNHLVEYLGGFGEYREITHEFMTQTALDIVVVCIMVIGPILLAAMLLGILPVIVQTKGLFTMKPLKPKFSKLNPISGMKRLFSAQSAVGILKGLIEIIAITIVVYLEIMNLMPKIATLPDMELLSGVLFTAETLFSLIMTIAVIFAFVAAGDYIFQWWQFEKKLKMTKQEIKDEYKQSEGDPQIKGKIKQKQREIAQNRMMEEVPQSDVVVRNPTHFAVALKYDYETPYSAPKVVAKGQDALALKIISIAEESGVYIKEDRPLARMLYERIEIGREIPADLYNAISIILTDVYEARGVNLSELQKKSAERAAAAAKPAKIVR